jgi:hypothetical protein
MSDDVSYAASIGASINRGLGSINPPKKKKPSDKDTEDKTKGPKKVKSTRTNAPKPEKKDKNIVDAVIVEPVKVKAERTNAPKELTTGQKQLPYNPNVGPQFKKTTGIYGTDNQPAVDLSKF